ncbi:hypothetical protein Sste5346_007112 [Sporothrix stenoceras]|uniref:Uncharacterized protein n=1 Tax=Sporothrix stenoceras TaxID=5173 RepID=A0ABR3YVH8_9PEZI
MDNNQSLVGYDPSQVAQYGVAMQSQQQQQQQQQQPTPQHLHHHHRHHSLVGWTAHPVAAYQLVPMDGSGGCGGYQPMYAHQNQSQPQQYQQIPHQQMSQQQQPTLYAFPQNMAMQQMQNMPPMTPMSPITPMTPGSGLSPIRRQPSFGNGSFYHPSPTQYQQFPPPGHQQQQQFYQLQPQGHNQHNHQLQRSQSIPVMSSHVLSGSPEVTGAFGLSPLRRAHEPYSPSMVFATPQPQPLPQPATPARNQTQDNSGDVFMDSPAVQAPFPLMPTLHASFMNHRPNKPKPLALSQSNLHSHRVGDENDPDHFQSAAQLAAHRRKPVSSASTGALPFPPSVTPVGSDREYDAGGSSYSTSPLGSEAQARIRARMRIPFVPRNLRRTATSVRVGTTVNESMENTPTATAATVLSVQPESSLEQFLQDHIHSIEANYADEKDDIEANRKGSGGGADRLLSSSDEWYTTSGTDPIRSRHRHRVVETHPRDKDGASSSASGVGICDCGMQQCCQCGLFISRPETHMCMVKKNC